LVLKESSTKLLKSYNFNFTGNETLIVLNPKSGAGKSREIFQEKVKPLLLEADLNHDVHVTRGRNDAK
jgi:sphingosine kinase